jgi:DNA modification methylase
VTFDEQIHQNQKPTELLSRIIKQHTKEGNLILDPFAGSFSTMVAAHRLKRDYIGFEIDDDYYAAGSKWLAAVKSQLSLFDFIT